MPKVDLLFELPGVNGQVFLNASRSFEPPLLLELNSLTVPGFIDLEAQDAWQFEAGTRGSLAGWFWDVSAYDIELENEIINVNVQPFPGAPFTVPTYRNATRTRHLGLEAGFGYTPLGSNVVGFRTSYTLGRYTFVDDANFDGNEIPGAPEHVVQVELSLRHPSGFSLSPTIEWVPGSYYLDSRNTLSNDGWTVLGVRREIVIPRAQTAVFFQLRNLTDEVYSPATSVDNGAGRFLQPADGRSLYVGTRWQL